MNLNDLDDPEQVDVAGHEDAGLVAEHIAARLERPPPLTSLGLHMSGLTDEQAEPLVAALHLGTQLRRLALNANALTDVTAASLADALQHLGQLEELLVHNNCLTDVGCAAICSQLEHVPHLVKLQLGANTLGVLTGTALRRQLRHVPHLQTLDLSWVECDDETLVAMAPGMASLEHLSTLYLEHNKFTAVGFERFVDSMNCPRLQTWWLGENQLGDEGVLALARRLHCFPELRALLINSCGVEELGATALAARARLCPDLDHVELNGNDIGPGGVRAFSAVLTLCPGLYFECGDDWADERLSVKEAERVLARAEAVFAADMMVQLLIGLRGPDSTALTRLASHEVFEPNVLSIVMECLSGKQPGAFLS